MKVAIIAPIPNLVLTRAGSMHLVLAHLVKHHHFYEQFYCREKKFKTLDNGAFENGGVPLSIEEIVQIAARINADEIVLPDTMYSGKETAAQVKKAIDYLKEKNLLSKYKLMAVVQGKTEPEWLECFEELHNIKEINTIAINKLSTPLVFGGSTTDSRLLVTKLLELHNKHTGKEYHLLGGSHEIIKEIKNQPKWVRSIDSSAPIEYGRRLIYLAQAKENLKTRIDFTKDAVNPANKNIILKNIQDIMEAANG